MRAGVAATKLRSRFSRSTPLPNSGEERAGDTQTKTQTQTETWSSGRAGMSSKADHRTRPQAQTQSPAPNPHPALKPLISQPSRWTLNRPIAVSSSLCTGDGWYRPKPRTLNRKPQPPIYDPSKLGSK